MLSQDLLSLQIWFDTTRSGQRAMSAEGAAVFSRALGVCFAQAVAMEETALAAIAPSSSDRPEVSTEEMIAQARALAGATNVVMLAASRRAGEHEFGFRGPNGGSAA
jgi:hypothetical protein